MSVDHGDDVDDALFDRLDVPAAAPTTPAGGAGGNLAALDKMLAKLDLPDDLAVAVEAARTGALALDLAVRGKNAPYAYQAAAKPYHDALRAIGLGGADPAAAGSAPVAGAAAADVIFGVFGAPPTVTPA